jgi:hypothetical protein
MLGVGDNMGSVMSKVIGSKKKLLVYCHFLTLEGSYKCIVRALIAWDQSMPLQAKESGLDVVWQWQRDIIAAPARKQGAVSLSIYAAKSTSSGLLGTLIGARQALS